jgi:autophagy-related protein 13
MSLPPHPPEVPLAHKKNTSFDEYYPSPNYTPSPSPSPPIYIPGSHVSKALLRSESAPVSIPAVKHASSPLLSNKQNLPPSPPLKATRSGNPKTDRSTGLVHAGATVEKVLYMLITMSFCLKGVCSIGFFVYCSFSLSGKMTLENIPA